MARQLDPHRAPGRRPPPQAPVSDSPVVACPPSDPRPLRWRGSSTRATHPAADPRRRGSSRPGPVAARPGRPVTRHPFRSDSPSPRRPALPGSPAPPGTSRRRCWRPAGDLSCHRSARPAAGERPLAGARPTDPRGGAGAWPATRRVEVRSTRQRFPRPKARVATSGASARQPGRRSAPAGRAGGKVQRTCPPPQLARRAQGPGSTDTRAETGSVWFACSRNDASRSAPARSGRRRRAAPAAPGPSRAPAGRVRPSAVAASPRGGPPHAGRDRRVKARG